MEDVEYGQYKGDKMAIEKIAIYRTTTGEIVNVIVVDTNNIPTLSPGLSYLPENKSINASTGDTWDGSKIVKSIITPPLPVKSSLITFGNYIGDKTNDRAITHGLGEIPKIIFIQTIPGKTFISIAGAVTPTNLDTGPAVTPQDKINFYVGNKADYVNSANDSNITYYWVALA